MAPSPEPAIVRGVNALPSFAAGGTARTTVGAAALYTATASRSRLLRQGTNFATVDERLELTSVVAPSPAE